MGRPSIGMQAHSHAPNRIVEFPDGRVSIGINRKQRGFYVAVMILPDGRVSAASAPTRKAAVAENIAALGLTTEQARRYHASNAP